MFALKLMFKLVRQEVFFHITKLSLKFYSGQFVSVFKQLITVILYFNIA